MKTRIIYTLLLLVCCTIGASPNRNSTGCDALSHSTDSAALPLDKGNTEAEEEAAIPATTGYLPGYSIIFMN